MRTQSQSFSPGGNVFTAKELPNLSYLLSQWSSQGFQNFLESGVLNDAVASLEKGKAGIISVKKHGMIRLSESPGDMKLGQIKELLVRLPERRWNDFYFCFVSWTFTAGWWDDDDGVHIPVGWQLRDEWREEMGLERNNPVRLLGPHGRLIFFKRGGHCRVPATGTLPGFLEPDYDDLHNVHDLPDELPIIVRRSGHWFRIGQRKDRFPWFDLSQIENEVEFFHQNTYFVPLVEL